MFYSKSTKGFYDIVVHGNNIPADAVEISATQHSQLLSDQASGANIMPDEHGFPVAVFPGPPTPAQIADARAAEIKTELSDLDLRRIRSMAEGDEEYLATLNARAEELREELQKLMG